MTDVFSKAKRSEVMAKVKGRGNASTEMALVRLLRSGGITGWRRHQALPGRPDFVFRAERVAVFVDGCFWHGCPKHGRMPTTNTRFWQEKIARTTARDRRDTRRLRAMGWSVMRIWEHCLTRRGEAAVLRRIERALARRG